MVNFLFIFFLCVFFSVSCECDHHAIQSPPTAPWVPKTVRFSDDFNGFVSARKKPLPPLMPLVPSSREFELKSVARKVATSSPLAEKSKNVNADADIDALGVQLTFNRHMQAEIEKLRKFIDQANKERDFYKMKLKSKGVENIDPNVGDITKVMKVNPDVPVNAGDGANATAATAANNIGDCTE